MRRIVIVCVLMCAACAGCQGERGPAGENGKNGDDGTDGQSGPQGPMGEQGFAGPQGPMGDSGEQGPAGPSGPKGADGARGPAGTAGAMTSSTGGGSSYRPSSYVNCVAQLDLVDGPTTLGQDNEPDTVVNYTIMMYSNDDVEVSCFAVFLSTESPQYAAYYPAIRKDASLAHCGVSADLPPYPANGRSVAGFWDLSVASGVPTALYNDDDPGHPLDGTGFMFNDDNCDSWVMSLGGMWFESTLADAL